MTAVKGKVVEGGRIIVPAAFRKSIGLSKGDTVLMELHGNELRVRPARSALRRIQTKLRALAPSEGYASDELIAERRAEADRE
jgi:AbrB family looped-hinge helix DNA binding protein